MTINTDTLAAEMLAGLDGVTPGEWVFDGPRTNHIIWAGSGDLRICFMTSDGPSTANAAHIARCSPPNISALLAEREAMKAEIERLREADWQPIETAPKDGTNILGIAPGYDWPEVVRYEEYDPDCAEEAGEPGFWRYSDDLSADVAELEISELTHWRPLPAPPSARAAQEPQL